MFFFLFSLSFLTLFHSGFSATAEEGTSKKRVVILAGMIKTGSSAAQRMFHFNAQNLKKQGVFYPHIWSIYQEFMKWTKKPYMTFEAYVAEGALFKKKDHYDNLFDFMHRYPNVKFEFFNFDKHRTHIVDTLLEKGHLPLDLTGFDRLDQALVNRALTASEHYLVTFLWKQGVLPDKRR